MRFEKEALQLTEKIRAALEAARNQGYREACASFGGAASGGGKFRPFVGEQEMRFASPPLRLVEPVYREDRDGKALEGELMYSGENVVGVSLENLPDVMKQRGITSIKRDLLGTFGDGQDSEVLTEPETEAQFEAIGLLAEGERYSWPTTEQSDKEEAYHDAKLRELTAQQDGESTIGYETVEVFFIVW